MLKLNLLLAGSIYNYWESVPMGIASAVEGAISAMHPASVLQAHQYVRSALDDPWFHESTVL